MFSFIWDVDGCVWKEAEGKMTAAVREKDEEPAISLKRTTGILMRLGFIADRNVKKIKKRKHWYDLWYILLSEITIFAQDDAALGKSKTGFLYARLHHLSIRRAALGKLKTSFLSARLHHLLIRRAALGKSKTGFLSARLHHLCYILRSVLCGQQYVSGVRRWICRFFRTKS